MGAGGAFGAGLFISKFNNFSVPLGQVFCSKQSPISCANEREIDGELLEYRIIFAPEMAPNGLRAIPEIGNKHARRVARNEARTYRNLLKDGRGPQRDA